MPEFEQQKYTMYTRDGPRWKVEVIRDGLLIGFLHNHGNGWRFRSRPDVGIYGLELIEVGMFAQRLNDAGDLD